MTLPRLTAMNEYWSQHPPLHVLIEALAGYRAPTHVRGSRLRELLVRFGGREARQSKA